MEQKSHCPCSSDPENIFFSLQYLPITRKKVPQICRTMQFKFSLYYSQKKKPILVAASYIESFLISKAQRDDKKSHCPRSPRTSRTFFPSPATPIHYEEKHRKFTERFHRDREREPLLRSSDNFVRHFPRNLVAPIRFVREGVKLKRPSFRPVSGAHTRDHGFVISYANDPWCNKNGSIYNGVSGGFCS